MIHPTPMRPPTASCDSAVALPRTVAVFRALQLGDMLCSVPALRALRAALPESQIWLIGLPWAREFAARFHRYVDRFLEFPGYPGLPERVPDLDTLPAFLSDARNARFDLVLQMHGSGEITNPLAVLLGGRATAGFHAPGQYCPDPARFIRYPDNERELRRPLALLRHLDICARGESLEFPLTEHEREEAREVTAAPLGVAPYVCVHAGARSAERRWAPEAFAAVADTLAERGLRVVLTGSEEEQSLTRRVAASMRTPGPVDVAGRTSLGGMAAVIGGARLLVCNDTGVSHIADALRVPSVVIFTGSDPARWAPLDAASHRVVRAPAGPSGRAARATIEQAIAEAHDLMGGIPVQQPQPTPHAEAPHAT